eukprot:COSAG02_NODE_556_length_20390_cov_88.575230_9_plen_169_part_00
MSGRTKRVSLSRSGRYCRWQIWPVASSAAGITQTGSCAATTPSAAATATAFIVIITIITLPKLLLLLLLLLLFSCAPPAFGRALGTWLANLPAPPRARARKACMLGARARMHADDIHVVNLPTLHSAFCTSTFIRSALPARHSQSHAIRVFDHSNASLFRHVYECRYR